MSEPRPASGIPQTPPDLPNPAAPPSGTPYSVPGQPHRLPPQPTPSGAQLPAQPYGHPGQAYGAQHPPYARGGEPSAARAGNTVGRTAFLVAVLSVGVGLVSQVVLQPLYAGSIIGWEVISGVQGILNFLVFVGAVAALALGVAALRRPAPHLLTAIAIGIAGNTILGTLASGLASVVYNFGF